MPVMISLEDQQNPPTTKRNPFAQFEITEQPKVEQKSQNGKRDPFAQFETQEEPKKEGRYGKVIGSAALSGITDIPAGVEDFLVRKPIKYGLKGIQAAGLPLSDETIEDMTKTTLPTSEILYEKGYLTAPETTGEKYTSAAVKGATGGAALGSRFGFPGAVLGAVGGAIASLGVQGARDLGISESWIDAAQYATGVSGLAAKKFAGPTKKQTAATVNRIGEQAERPTLSRPSATIQEQALEHLQKPLIQSEGNRNIPVGPGASPRDAAALAGRVSRDVSQFATRPTPTINNVLSPNEFTSEAEGGHTLNELSVNRFNQRSEISRDNFEQAAVDAQPYEFNFGDTENLRELVQRTRTELEHTGSPSRAERAVLTRLQDVEALIGGAGDLQGGPAQRLIATSNSIGQSLNHDLDYVGTENLLRPIVHELNVAARTAVSRGGGSIERINHADDYYSNLADTFLNKDMRPYLNELVSNPESLYKMAKDDPGKFRSLYTALHDTEDGRRALNILTNDLVNDRFKDYIKDPSKIGDQHFRKLMKDMHALIGNEAAGRVQDNFYSRKIANQRLKTATPRTKEVHASSKYLEMPIEQFEKKLDTISGIREISRDLEKTDNGRRLASQLWRSQAENIFKDGQAHPKAIKASRAAELLNQEKNFKIISEFIGEEAAKSELENLQSLGQKDINRSNSSKYIKNGILFKLFHDIFI